MKPRKTLPKRDTFTYFVEGEFPTMNEFIAAAYAHRQQGARMKATFTDVVKFALTGEDRVDLTLPLSVEFIWYRKNALSDLDNISFAQKFVLDGMVRAGIIPEDNIKVITEIRHRMGAVDQRDVGVAITFTTDAVKSESNLPSSAATNANRSTALCQR